MANGENKWQEKLRSLMAKAEDPATTPEERDNIVSRVTYLMAKYGIEEAMLKSTDDKPEVVINVRVKIQNPYVNQQINLLYNIGKVFGCQAIMLNDGDGKILRMFGHQGDIERSYMLFGSLVIQMFSGIASAAKPVGVHGKSFNTSFVNAYVDTVINRVKAAYQKAKDEIKSTTGNGMDLVLVNRDLAVKNAFKEEYPRITMRSVNSTSSSSAGQYAGHSAGQRANIGQTGLAGGRRAIGN